MPYFFAGPSFIYSFIQNTFHDFSYPLWILKVIRPEVYRILFCVFTGGKRNVLDVLMITMTMMTIPPTGETVRVIVKGFYCSLNHIHSCMERMVKSAGNGQSAHIYRKDVIISLTRVTVLPPQVTVILLLEVPCIL